VAPSYDSRQVWDQCIHWLNACHNTHEVCKQGDSDRVFPDRLIDTETQRIVVGSAAQETGYAALSYAWGFTPMMTNTMARSAAFSDAIDILTLPKTHKDAITVTRKLGLRYLWIDALCIIQDDAVKKLHEIEKMHLIYRDCVVNISALDAPHTDAGFLHPRPLQATAHISDNVHIRQALPSWGEIFRRAPLSQRGWVLQERLMSKRVLHFGSTEIFWECLTVSARESRSKTHSLEGRSTDWDDENFKRALLFDTQDSELILKRWYAIISQYTSLHLSYPSDVFPAIAGVALEFAKATSFKYSWGLWIEHIHSGLLWYRHYLPREDRPIDEQVRHVPTWSWAYRMAPSQMLFSVESRPTETPLQANVLSAPHSMSKNMNPAGPEVEMTLSALCGHVWLKRSHGLPPYNDPYLALVVDVYDSNGLMLGTGYLDSLGISMPNDLEPSLAVVISQRVGPPYGSSPVTYFLLVKRAAHPTRDLECFERIGIAQTADPFHGSLVPETTFAMWKRGIINLI
jgi:hypothetical protein